MLLIPADRRIDWRNPPLITLALILVNCFIFLVLQSDDRQYQRQAMEHYLGSELPAIEFPAYQRWLEEHNRIDEARAVEEWLEAPEEEQDAWRSSSILWQIEDDSGFRQSLEAGEIITPEHPQYTEWREDRRRFREILNQSLTSSYGFRPAEPTPVTAISHMFLHGSFMHLLGNMIFLLMAGFLLEMALGRAAYVVSYLLGGLCAVFLHWAIDPASAAPLVGASGAISGVMGAFAVLYGLRRIRFFYMVLFYFGFIRAPAVAMLPVWLAAELFQAWRDEAGNIAYFAHIGGFIGGAAIAALHRYFGGAIDTEFMDAPRREEEERDARAEALSLIERLRLNEARQKLLQLRREFPSDRDLLQRLYAVNKFDPASEEYHRVAHEILQLPDADPDTLKLIHATFRDYLQSARPGVRLSLAQYTDLADTFVRGGYLDDAEKILQLLLKQRRVSRRVPGVTLRLAQARLKQQARDSARNWLGTVVERFPATGEAQQARQLLDWSAPPQES